MQNFVKLSGNREEKLRDDARNNTAVAVIIRISHCAAELFLLFVIEAKLKKINSKMSFTH